MICFHPTAELSLADAFELDCIRIPPSLSFVFNLSVFSANDRVVSQVEYPSLVDLRGLLLDLVAQLLGALSRIRSELILLFI